MFLRILNNLLNSFSLLLIGIYRSLGSAWLGGACRFEPSCSEYSQVAFRNYPFTTAFKLSFQRICSCRPGGRFGYDPVPPHHNNNKITEGL